MLMSDCQVLRKTQVAPSGPFFSRLVELTRRIHFETTLVENPKITHQSFAQHCTTVGEQIVHLYATEFISM